MALTRGHFLGYEFDRMVMLFSMVDGQREISCDGGGGMPQRIITNSRPVSVFRITGAG